MEFRLGFSYLSPDRQARNGTNQAAVLKELQTWFIYTHLQSLSAHRSVSMQRVFLHKCSARAVQQELLQRETLSKPPVTPSRSCAAVGSDLHVRRGSNNRIVCSYIRSLDSKLIRIFMEFSSVGKKNNTTEDLLEFHNRKGGGSPVPPSYL